MWLINAETLELENHPPPARDESLLTKISPGAYAKRVPRPEYSILSHRWGNTDDEVNFQDMKDDQVRRQKDGFQKIQECCRQSLDDDISHVWIDTCCINKDSDAELSESINSMYTWYSAAKVCYIFLEDHENGVNDVFETDSKDVCEWFTRGWTLQELVAPSQAIFFDRYWNHIGDRSTLSAEIEAASGIPQSFLEKKTAISQFSVAQRMSWAASRVTTRPEDRAYSLIGIFEVNMSLIYGEGGLRAFRRLQEEIIKSSHDHTIFAWPRSAETMNYGLLAYMPDAFQSCGTTQITRERRGNRPYTITNRGLSISLSMTPWCMDTYLALLPCHRHDADYKAADSMGIGIFLRRSYEDDTVHRVSVDDDDTIYNPKAFMTRPGFSEPIFREVMVNVPLDFTTTAPSVVQQSKANGFRLLPSLIDKYIDHQFDDNVRPTFGTEYVADNQTIIKTHGPADSVKFARIMLRSENSNIERLDLYLDLDFSPFIALGSHAAMYKLDRHIASIMRKTRVGEAVDPAHWNEQWNVRGQQVAAPNKLSEDFWMLKADRVNGIDIVLFANQYFGRRKHDRLILTPSTEEVDGQTYWDVDLVEQDVEYFAGHPGV